jgi:hypothetical protein
VGGLVGGRTGEFQRRSHRKSALLRDTFTDLESVRKACYRRRLTTIRS